MAALTLDSLRSAIAAVNPFTRGRPTATTLPTGFEAQLALAAYALSGMLRKVIAIPAEDRVREWRDWQADKDTIALIEAEEKRLGIQAKLKFAEVLRGIGGGAMILVTAGNHAEELKPETVKQGGLVAVNVISRWQITPVDFDRNVASPTYGLPARYQVVGANGAQQYLHPSRVIAFRGDPIALGAPGLMLADEEAFWGDSRLLRVFREVIRSDETQEWFAALVKKAKLLRIGISDLEDYLESKGGMEKLTSRVALIAEGESAINATIYRLGKEDQNREEISDYQVSWTGIPAVMDAFDQRVAAVADIPFTRLMGRSPAGMNATGKHDTENWDKMVASGQRLETRPCLDQLDAVMLPSAGVTKPDEVTWKFAPLTIPTEAEEATTFNTSMDAVVKLQNTGTVPHEALAKAVQNFMAEREYLPGLDQALEDIPDDERYGLDPADDPNMDPNEDPSALTEQTGGTA